MVYCSSLIVVGVRCALCAKLETEEIILHFRHPVSSDKYKFSIYGVLEFPFKSSNIFHTENRNFSRDAGNNGENPLSPSLVSIPAYTLPQLPVFIASLRFLKSGSFFSLYHHQQNSAIMVVCFYVCETEITDDGDGGRWLWLKQSGSWSARRDRFFLF